MKCKCGKPLDNLVVRCAVQEKDGKRILRPFEGYYECFCCGLKNYVSSTELRKMLKKEGSL
jgi:hypothetical protein